MSLDTRLRPMSRRAYLDLFSDWNSRALARLQRQLEDPNTIGGICFVVLDRRSAWHGAKAHLPVGPDWTVKSFRDVFKSDDDWQGRPLTHDGVCKYPVYAYRKPITAFEQLWEECFNRHWYQYLELDSDPKLAARDTLVAVNLELAQHYHKQWEVLTTQPGQSQPAVPV